MLDNWKLTNCDLFIFWIISGAKCTVAVQKTYTTQDASVLTSIAYITEFQLNCDGKPLTGSQLHAESQGRILQVAENSGNYQVSWTEDIGAATKGDHSLRILDDDGVSLLRKVCCFYNQIQNTYSLVQTDQLLI